MARLIFDNKNAFFFQSLKEETSRYFAENKIRPTGNWRLYSKTIILIVCAVAMYTAVLFMKLPLYGIILLGILLGLTSALIGFNVMHDANHGSYSRKRWVNEFLGLTLNALGGNSFIWKFKHNIIHHTYTNVDGMDDDIAKSPFIRMCSTQQWKPAHRWQHLYTPLLYAISSLIWVLYLDFDKYFRRRILTTAMTKMKMSDHILFWVSKLLYIVFYLVLPIVLCGTTNGIVFFLSLHLSLGFTLAIVFQLAHVVEDTEFEFVATDDVKRIENEWAIHQIKTTADFSPGNPVISWLLGGLNYQVEHHLFPRISHVHYPALSVIVRKKCTEFGLQYNCIPSFGKAVQSHFRFIRVLGEKPLSTAIPETA